MKATTETQPWYYRFHDLMLSRVREVLLVASSYDTLVIEERGWLNDTLFAAYRDLRLVSVPRVTMAQRGTEAMDLLRERPFDLVITMARLEDMDANAFGRQVKAHDPRLPVVLLMLSETGADQLQVVDRSAVDMAFLWTGDVRLLLAIVKLIEDRLNVAHDTERADVRVVLVVEDSIRHYSTFLPLLYSEIIPHSRALIAPSLDEHAHRMVRQSRPKILLARSYEEAIAYYERFREYLLAVITDVSFPKEGVEREDTGIKLVRHIHLERRDVPMLILSSEQANAARADELGVQYVNKTSPSILQDIRQFILGSLGFGEFVFRLPDFTEVGRATDIEEMGRALLSIPGESIAYHSEHNHFSTWLMARSLFHLAALLRPRRLEEFGDVEELREHLLGVIQQARLHDQTGVIHSFSGRRSTWRARLVRLGTGSIGGKARGLAFAESVIERHGLSEAFEGLPIQVPRTVAIGTDEFDRFLERNPEARDSRESLDEEIVRTFIEGQLSEAMVSQLAGLVEDMSGPLAVRSSSLLEDSHAHPFAGIYATYMLPNNHPDPKVRAEELCRAVKAVYASTYCRNARAFLRGTPFDRDEEKMGVLVQEVVGREHGGRFYPTISGVGRSYNHYPVRYQRAEEGIVLLALGLGHGIVLGGSALQFSPRSPDVLPQFASAKDFVRYGQARFYAIELGRSTIDFSRDVDSSLGVHTLDVAKEDGTLALVGGVYRPEEDCVRDDISLSGVRVLTFANILRWRGIPLVGALDKLLVTLRDRMGCPAEIEFAVDLPSYGHDETCLYVLQVRPQLHHVPHAPIASVEHEPDEVLCHTRRSLGHGALESIRDIVWVKPGSFDSSTAPVTAREVGQINARLLGSEHGYVLVGPGRWGTSDPRLGVPVEWAEISAARVIIETSLSGRSVEPSQGAHFFHNIVSSGTGYLTLSAIDQESGEESFVFDDRWLAEQPVVAESSHVVHIRLSEPLRIFLDGSRGEALILKPHPPTP